MEHAISPDVEIKLVEALGFPETNPYGLPIPGYSKTSKKSKPLADGREGETMKVSQVPEEDIQLLTYFDEINVRPGAEVVVKESAPFKGTVTIEVNGEPVVLGLEVARKIQVAA